MKAKIHPVAVNVTCGNCDAVQDNALDGSHIWDADALRKQQGKHWVCLNCGARLTVRLPAWA